MTVAGALRQGLTEATRRFHIAVCLYAANLIAAAALALPAAFLLDRALGRSVAADGLEAIFRFEVLIDFLRSNREALSDHFQSLGVGAVLYAIAAALLSGGAIDTLKGPPRSPFLPRFLGGCGRLAFRFLRLLPYLAVALAGLHWLGRALDRLILALFDQSAHEVAAFWAMRGKQGLLLLLLLLLAAIFDLARVLTAIEDRTHMIGALLTASGFVARHLGPVLGLYGVLLGFGLLLFVPYLLVAHHLLPASSIVGLFVLQQVVMLLRHWFRVAGFASLIAFYRGTVATPSAEAGDEEIGIGSAATAPRPGGAEAAPVAPMFVLALLAAAALMLARPGISIGHERSGPTDPPVHGRVTAGAAAGTQPGGAVAAYEIEAALDPERRLVRGRETILYRNAARLPMTELKLHLYPNAFSNDRSVYMRGISWTDRTWQAQLERMRREGSWGSMTVQSVRAGEGVGVDVTPLATVDETVMTVPLPAPVRPGESARLQIVWETLLPRTFHRMGYWGEHFDVMQWFPKPGVFTDQGWRIYPFYRYSEFFADFGSYRVTLTAPARFRVEATGIPDEPRSNPDGTRSVTYRAEEVHDFAWIADPNAEVAREVVSEGPYAASPVEVLYVHQPYRRIMAPRVLRAVKDALLYYGQRVMPYPYPRLVVDDLPMGLGSGMEYPMLFTVSSAWFLPRFYQSTEEIAVHEFGHQYWYGLVATNEFEEPWLDEGINSYVTRRVMDRAFGAGRPGRTVNALFAYAATRVLDEGLEARLGNVTLNLDQLLGFHDTPFRAVGGGLLGHRLYPWYLDLPGLTEGRLLGSKEGYGGVAGDDPIVTPSWGFLPGSYADIVYDKTDVALETLARLVGADRLDEALRAYAVRYRLAHPTSRDFFATLQESVARTRPDLDLRPFIDQLFYGTGTVDFAVTSLRSREIGEPRGLVPAPKAGQPPLDRSLPPPETGEGPTRYETEVIVRRLGEVVLPVEILVRFESGEEVREAWDGRTTWKRLVYERSTRADRAIVDPAGILAIDLDRNNNGLTLERQTRTVARLSLLWLFWLQNYLHLAAALS